MFTPKWLLGASLLLAPLMAAGEPPYPESPYPDSPRLGQSIAPQEISSITIWPNGQGLPQGSGNAVAGRTIYQQQCLACHGQTGSNGVNDALAGGQVALSELPKVRTLGSYWPYATSLFDYVRRAMPYRQPGSLSNDEVYSVVAYLLFLNELIDEQQTLDAARLSKVKLPNRQRFYSEYELP